MLKILCPLILGYRAKDQENPNFNALDTLGSLSNDPIFDPGMLGKRSDGTEITKLYAKPEVKKASLVSLDPNLADIPFIQPTEKKQ